MRRSLLTSVFDIPGTIPESRLNSSVKRILELKYDLGLLDEIPEACAGGEHNEPDDLTSDRQEALDAVR